MADERTEHQPPGLHGQPEPGSPYHTDPYVDRPYGYAHRLPESPTSGWLRKNFTLGNLIMIVTMLLAAGAWMRSAETGAIAVEDRVQQAERRLDKLQQDTISKELLAARLDTIAARLQAIEDRLTRIERMK